jgi:uncharacterized membrane protein YphA (DoxX/SURF4 family)
MAEIALCVRFCVAGIFLIAGGLKWRSARPIGEAVADYEVLPEWLIHPVASALIPVELLVGVSLLLGVFPDAMLVIAAMILSLFCLAVVTNLLRSRPIDCGCWGDAKAQISWWLVVRNGALAAASITAAGWQPVGLSVYDPNAGGRTLSAQSGLACLLLTLMAFVTPRVLQTTAALWMTWPARSPASRSAPTP